MANSSVTYLLGTAQDKSIRALSLGESETWSDAPCPYCGQSRALVVAAETDGNYKQHHSLTTWFRCVSCRKGYVRQNGAIQPGVKPLRTPMGVPGAEASVWEEARTCLGVGAHTAAVMLCRKLLFHVAVTHGLAPTNEKGFAPGFAECAKHLQNQGLVTPRMMKWVERIKDVGNDANHALLPIAAAQALDVAAFTEQLLILTYELDARMEAADSSDEAENDTGEALSI